MRATRHCTGTEARRLWATMAPATVAELERLGRARRQEAYTVGALLDLGVPADLAWQMAARVGAEPLDARTSTAPGGRGRERTADYVWGPDIGAWIREWRAP